MFNLLTAIDYLKNLIEKELITDQINRFRLFF